jgi:AcrR family transcriptional regulator
VATTRVKKGVRADSLRNRARVLEAAHAVFAEKGVALTTEEVAKRAAVGIGTLFRHFPTKASLYEALVEARFEALALWAEELRANDVDSGKAFFMFLERMMHEGPAKRALFDALATTGVDVKARLVKSTAKMRVKEAMSTLLVAAQRAGHVRSDVDVRDVYAVLVGAGAVLDQFGGDVKLAKRALRVVLDGLRAR